MASIKMQKIFVFHNGKSEKEYLMSSSKNPPSCLENSLGTPWGLHEVCEKIGGGEPLGTVFEARKSTGLRFSEFPEQEQRKNLITTRILRLMGLEKDLNQGGKVDSFRRFIYVHGTNHEQNLGKPASSGCLQLSNDDVIDLFERVPLGSHLLILRDFQVV